MNPASVDIAHMHMFMGGCASTVIGMELAG